MVKVDADDVGDCGVVGTKMYGVIETYIDESIKRVGLQCLVFDSKLGGLCKNDD